MKIKNYIISALLILVLVLSVVVTYKKGYLGSLFRKDNSNISLSGSSTPIKVKTEPIKKDDVTIINKGESFVINYEDKDDRQNVVEENSYIYNLKYVDSYISKELKSNMNINFYQGEEKNCVDLNSGELLKDYSYVYLEVDYTNSSTGNSTFDSIAPQNLNIGYFDADNNYIIIGEPRGNYADGISGRGIVSVPKGTTVSVISCYIVPDEYLDKTLMIQGEIVSGNTKGPDIPYFQINNY